MGCQWSYAMIHKPDDCKPSDPILWTMINGPQKRGGWTSATDKNERESHGDLLEDMRHMLNGGGFGMSLGGPSCSNFHLSLRRRSREGLDFIRQLSVTQVMTCLPIKSICASWVHLCRWSKNIHGDRSRQSEDDACTFWVHAFVDRVAPNGWYLDTGHAKGLGVMTGGLKDLVRMPPNLALRPFFHPFAKIKPYQQKWKLCQPHKILWW